MTRVLNGPICRECAMVKTRRKRIFRREPIVRRDRQISGFGKLLDQLAIGGRAAKRPGATVDIDNDWMRSSAFWHREIALKSALSGIASRCAPTLGGLA